MSHDAIALPDSLIPQVLQTGLLDGLGAGVGMLVVDVGVDQLQVSVALGDPGGQGGRGIGGQGSIVVGSVGVGAGGGVENERSVAVLDRSLANAIVAAGRSATIEATSTSASTSGKRIGWG